MWRRIGRNSLIFGGGAILMAILQAGYRLLAIDELSVSHYGQVALIISIFNGIALAGMAGVPVALARLGARVDGPDDRTLLGNALRASALPSVLAAAGMGAVTLAILGSPGDAAIAAAGMPALVLSSMAQGYLQGRDRIWAAASIQPVNTIAQLAVLIAVIATGVDVGVGWVMTSFYIGNVAALLYGALMVFRRVDLAERRPATEDARPSRILGFSLYLTLATLAVFLLPILSRIGVANLSYAEVAFFDLALLLYSIPERLAASVVNALIPVASNAQSLARRVAIPGRRDVVVLTALVAGAALVLWETHAARSVLEAVGLERYGDAEPLLLIVLVGAPAELFFMLNVGLLSAFGQSRRLAVLAGAVFGVSLVLVPLAAMLGAEWLAALLVLDFWALYLGSSAILPEGDIERRRIGLKALSGLRAKRVPA